MRRSYVDSSVILASILREIEVDSWRFREDEILTSDLTDLECRRTLDRIRIQEALPDQEVSEYLQKLNLILRAMFIIQLGAHVLKRAKASYPTVVKSLDAIHLASAELASATHFISQDQQQRVAAQAMGLVVDAPIE